MITNVLTYSFSTNSPIYRGNKEMDTHPPLSLECLLAIINFFTQRSPLEGTKVRQAWTIFLHSCQQLLHYLLCVRWRTGIQEMAMFQDSVSQYLQCKKKGSVWDVFATRSEPPLRIKPALEWSSQLLNGPSRGLTLHSQFQMELISKYCIGPTEYKSHTCSPCSLCNSITSECLHCCCCFKFLLRAPPGWNFN